MATTNETALNTELSLAFRQLYAINRSIVAERERGNVAGVQAMLPLYQTWLDKYKAVSVKLGQEDFTAFDKFVLDTGTYIQKAAAAVPDVTSAIGKGILKGVWPFALLAVGWLWFRGKL